ncbi:MAG: PIG-L family deacetylase [Chloroflexota bacterium]|jgi:LmbE family N-acetylglucosaminyl deacetylase|nr:PIG-L family deacetylase [Chloroflexota bacterium]
MTTTNDALRILIFGAHPDDPDFSAGGTAALYARLGHTVKLVSLTNGDAGHHTMGGAPLAWRRRAEAAASGATLGAEYVTLDIHDGALLPSLENRHTVIAVIRQFRPDLVMVHRPNDYHPDHRYASQLVQDASYMVTVPNVVSHVPHLRAMPVIVHTWDHFQKPYPFQADVVIGIDEVVEQKVDALCCHESQVFEWLPYNGGYLDDVPAQPEERRAWLRTHLEPRLCRIAGSYRDKLIRFYGEAGRNIRYAEAFEVCEYGAPLDEVALRRLFPFFPSPSARSIV